MQVNMHEAKSRLSQLVESVCRGEEVYIARNGVPVAKIVPVAHRGKRVLGAAKDLIDISEDFYRPMTDAELDEFLGR
jgi:prevent-host-death family protein